MTLSAGDAAAQAIPATIAGRPTTILLVDDEPLNLDLLAQELDAFDLRIETAANGQEALDRVRQSPPDMVFLDLMMPVMDGFAVLDQLRSNPDWRSIPVVIISASDDLPNVVRGIEMGADDFLPKPFEPTILRARLLAGLEKRRLAALEHLYLKSLERELEIGREIQAGFLPQRLPQPDGWGIRAHFQAAREVAGDFYDVFDLGPDKLAFMLGDVTDKGVGSALFMALYRSLLRSSLIAERLMGEPLEGVSEAPEACLKRTIELVNRYVCQTHGSAMLATVFVGIVDVESGQLWYTSAGHDPPLLVGQTGIQRQLQPTGPVLGVIEAAEYQIEFVSLSEGEGLVLYSDGVPDARNGAGEMFGTERFRAVLEGAGSAAASFDTVLAALADHIGGSDPYDDVTLLVLHREF